MRGTLDPVHIDADIIADTDDFEVYDKAYNHPARKHMIGVRAATVRAKIGVRPHAFEFYDIRNTFGKSQLTGKLVSIGFKNDITLAVGGAGTRVAFEDISPLVDIPIAGMSQFNVTMTGKASNPTLKGKMRVADLVFGGFPIGDITHADVFFRPLKVDIGNARGKKGKSHFRVPRARLNFDTDAAVLVTADVKSDDLRVRDFLSMWLFEKDPRFDGLYGQGKVNARVEFDYGGRRDRCGGGYLAVNGDAGFKKMEIFEERYDTGSASFDFRWMDRDASHLGMTIDIPSMTLTKGRGAVLGSLRVSDGGRIAGNVVGTGVPLSTVQALGALGPLVDGFASGLATVSGTIDDLSLDADVGVSDVGVGLGTLPRSRVAVRLRPTKRDHKTIGTTKCGRPMPAEFNRKRYDRDEPAGVFTASGSLFGGQVKLSELTVTRQRAKIVAGSAELSKLDLGVLTQLSPKLALDKQRPDGELSGLVTIEHLPLEKYEDAKITFDIADAAVRRGGLTARIAQSGKSVRYDRGDLFLPALAVNVETQGGFQARFDVAGQVTDVMKRREVDVSLKLQPIDLSKLVRRVPRVERADGRVVGGLRIKGPPSALRYSGGFEVQGGELAIAGLPSALSKVNVAVVVDGDELRIAKGSAKLGGGSLKLSGNAKLGSTGVTNARAVVTAKNVGLPIMSGVEAAADAKLVATWEPARPGASEGEALPRITGDVNIRNFAYNRPVHMTADLASLAQRGKRTEFEAYDPADDSVKFDVIIRSNRPLKISNNLVEAELEIGKKGLLLAGTNQRYGMRGLLAIKSGGRIRLRRNEFEVRQGRVRFSDLTRDRSGGRRYRRNRVPALHDLGVGHVHVRAIRRWRRRRSKLGRGWRPLVHHDARARRC